MLRASATAAVRGCKRLRSGKLHILEMGRRRTGTSVYLGAADHCMSQQAGHLPRAWPVAETCADLCSNLFATGRAEKERLNTS